MSGRQIYSHLMRKKRVTFLQYTKKTYQLQRVPNPWRQHEVRVSQHQSHWRKCWRNRLHLQWSCHWASVHRAGCHVPSSTTPNTRFRSGNLLVRRGLRYTHAKCEKCKNIPEIRLPWMHYENFIHTNIPNPQKSIVSSRVRCPVKALVISFKRKKSIWVQRIFRAWI